jgi:hypothetical protein
LLFPFVSVLLPFVSVSELLLLAECASEVRWPNNINRFEETDTNGMNGHQQEQQQQILRCAQDDGNSRSFAALRMTATADPSLRSG